MSVVQTATGTGGGVSSLAVDWTSDTTTGNLICVMVGFQNSSITVTSVTDEQSNTYDLIKTVAEGAGRNAYIYRAKNITGGVAPTVTVNVSSASNFKVGLIEASALGTSAPDGANDSNTGTGTAVTGSATGISGTAGSLVVGSGVNNDNSTKTVGGGFTELYSSTKTYAQYRWAATAPSSDTVPYTLATSTDWGECCSIFSADAAAGNPWYAYAQQ